MVWHQTGEKRAMDESALVDRATASLWRNGSFVRLWFAQVISNAGSQITNLALPLTAVLTLSATPAQMGLLGVAGSLPNLFFGLLAGVWVDRMRRRPILLGADFGRALLLGTIPLAALLGSLTFAHLYVVAFASASLGLFFTIASVAVLPSVVRKDQLVEANSRLAASDSVLAIAGPSAAGALVQVLSAPKAIFVDAVSYVLSALSLRGVGVNEESPNREQRRSLRIEIGEGVRELVRTPVLRALTVAATVGVFGAAVQTTVLLFFFTRELDIPPTTISLVYAVAGVGGLLGAIVAGRVARRIGTGPSVILGQALWAISALVVPLAGIVGPALAPIIAAQVITGVGGAIWSVNQMSLRQHLTPTRLLGRVTAARRFLLFGAAPLGSVLGGFLGSTLRLRGTLLVGAIGVAAGFVLLFFSPVRSVRNPSVAAPSA